MAIMKLTYAGKEFLADYNTFVDFSGSFPTPDKDIEFVEIMGKNGSLAYDNNRFNDMTIEFPCYIRSNFISRYRNLMAFLASTKGYQRLETDYEPNHFRKAMYLGGISPDPKQFNTKGLFKVPFRVHPERWLKSGETQQTITASSETLTGNPVTVNNSTGLTSLDSVSVDIEPIQPNQYDSVWVGGAGKNLLKLANNDRSVTANDVTVTYTAETDMYRISGESTSQTAFITLNTPPLNYPNFKIGETYTISTSKSTNALWYFNLTYRDVNNVLKGFQLVPIQSQLNKAWTFTVPDDFSEYWRFQIGVYKNTTTIPQTDFHVQIERGSTATSWTPYENICPISGSTSATVTVTNGGDTDTYTVDMTDAGTVYGGTLNVTTGELSVTMANIASYAGESINEPWVSDRDVYSAGTTPTTGAQVVYTLASPTTYTLTAQQISLLTGTNTISTDMDSLSVVITEPTTLTNPTLFESRPIIRIYGDGTVNINNQYITVANSPYTYIDLDCETMDASYDSNNANSYVTTSGLITLPAGANYIAFTCSQLKITPRWWEV